MSRRSCLARGDQRTRLGVTALLASVPDEFLDVELLALAAVEFAETSLQFAAQRGEHVQSFEQFPTDLLLSSLGKTGGPRHGQFQRFHHSPIYSTFEVAASVGSERC